MHISRFALEMAMSFWCVGCVGSVGSAGPVGSVGSVGSVRSVGVVDVDVWSVRPSSQTYSDPPFAAISIETGVPVEILRASHIEMNQVKMPGIMRIARHLSVCALCDVKVCSC